MCLQYLRLSQEVTNVLETKASPATVGALVSRLRAAATCSQSEFLSMAATTMAAVREEQTWQVAMGRFSKRLGVEFPYLPDLSVPVCLAVEEVGCSLVMMMWGWMLLGDDDVGLGVLTCQADMLGMLLGDTGMGLEITQGERSRNCCG